MIDNFEKAKDKILKEARANGGVTTDHLLDALIATNKDLDEKLDAQQQVARDKHEETRAWYETVTGMVEEHIDEAKVRDVRLDALEGFRLATEENCEARVKRICEEEHQKTHGEYVDSLQKKRSRIYWFFATSTGKVALLLFGIIAGIIAEKYL